jgi:predicted TIM-barrel fold metal-dependent hydrolase
MSLTSYTTTYDNQFTNYHCHILNSALYPPDVFFDRLRIPKTMVLAASEVAKEQPWLVNILNNMAQWFSSDKTLHLKQVVDIFNSGFDEAAAALMQSMYHANIAGATPLMLDLGCGGGDYVQMPWELQIEKFGSLYKRSNGILRPFYGFDPRRKDSFKLAQTAIESGNFFGFKFYPSQGFCPNFMSSSNTDQANAELQKLYAYAAANGIPITVHGSKGGIRGRGISPAFASYLNSPANWWDVLFAYPMLKVNFAHFGGNTNFMDYFLDGKSNMTAMIVDLMMEFEYVYADLSFHEASVNKRRRYYNALRAAFGNIWVANRLLYGDDNPLTLSLYPQKEKVDRMCANMTVEQKMIIIQNGVDFEVLS